MRRDREMMKVDAPDKIGRLGMCITRGPRTWPAMPFGLIEIHANEIIIRETLLRHLFIFLYSIQEMIALLSLWASLIWFIPMSNTHFHISRNDETFSGGQTGAAQDLLENKGARHVLLSYTTSCLYSQ